MEIAEIKKYMKDKHITYNELADMSGISISTIKKIFSGISVYPRIDTIRTIEKALGIEEEKTAPEYTEAEMQLFELIKQLTDEETEELSNFLDFILSKRK